MAPLVVAAAVRNSRRDKLVNLLFRKQISVVVTS
jgi:hypothetical protein